MRRLSLFLFLILGGCQLPQNQVSYDPVDFDSLPGWHEDRLHEAKSAMTLSCQEILKKDGNVSMITGPDGQGRARDWHPFCRNIIVSHPKQVRSIIENHLRPYRLSSEKGHQGTITGYYEPILRGSKQRHGPYQTPLYRLPSNGSQHKVPRSQIVNGALKGKGLELVWVDDPVEAFFIQIQGSGKVSLPDGQLLKLGFAGQNGHPYFPIGKALVDRGELTPDNVSMQTIKAWLKSHPKEAEKIMSLNPSYVFFKVNNGLGPIGSQGVPLTAKRSLAVDRKYVSLGTPVWLNADHPISHKKPLQQLVVAQDTGGAIKGAIRGDLFWGTGDEAGKWAGVMNSRGELYVLLPR